MTNLPSGTVTFFFSDIEGSTKLLQRLGSEFRGVLERHGEIVRAVFAAHGGVEVSTEGDSFFAVFSAAPDAVEAAGVVQQEFAKAEWPDGGTVAVRIGLHTGLAELGADNYVGLDVNRAARISDVGHGGQVVVSAATRALAGTSDFIDLGTHRLKDIERPEHLHQLVVADLPTSFPPLRTLDARPNNLPIVATQLLGRDDETSQLLDRIRRHRLVSIVGPGGVGKTRLAIDVAAAALPEFASGVFFVDLAPITDPTLVLSTIAAELGIEESEPAAVAQALAAGARLLVLDSLEHVIAAASQVRELLAACDDLKVLATSQVPLRLGGEDVFRLAPLGVGGDGPNSGSSAAVELFAARATNADPTFSLVDNAADVTELVVALDGLPLAVELAAARVNVLTPAQILERLHGDTAVLETRAADAPARHRSLQDAVGWSYDLLTSDQQAVLRSLSVFRGGATLAGLESVAAGDVLDDLGELVDRSLVRTSNGASSKRFNLLDGVLRYAAGQLDDSEAAEMKERHAVFFTEMVPAAAVGLTGDRSAWWLASLGDDHENLQAVLGRMLEGGDFLRAFAILGNLWRYYQGSGRFGELSLWLDRFFQVPRSDQPSAALVKALMARGAVSYWRADFDGSAGDYRLAIGVAAKVGDPQLEADAHYGLATSLGNTEAIDEAFDALAVAKGLYEEIDDAFGRAGVMSFEVFYAMRNEGADALRAQLGEAVKLFEESGHRILAAQAILGFVGAELAEGDFDAAKRHALASLELAEQAGDRFMAAWSIEVLATALVASGEIESGAQLAGAAAAARDRMGGGWPGGLNIGTESAEAQLIAAIGEEAARELMAHGADLSLGRAIEIAKGS